MSFSRHQRSIVRWASQPGGTVSGSAQPLTVSMSRSWLFLGGLLSSSARFRFTSRHHLHAVGCICKPRPLRVADFSTGEMRKFQPVLTPMRFPHTRSHG